MKGPANDLRVATSEGRGRGVYATRAFRPGETIESCPVIELDPGDRSRLESTVLAQYFFSWKGKAAALPLGYGMLYNHASEPNARYHKDERNRTITFSALRDIRSGEEITVNYNGSPADHTARRFG